MELQEITVEEFRTLRDPITVCFGPGLNVLHGRNEIGKSTLALAIWSALTVPSKTGGAVHRAMIPRGGGTPQVALKFIHGGRPHFLRKAFGGNRKGKTLLRVEGDGTVEEVQDEAAEERMRRLMGVEVERGAPAIHQVGLWPVVWVRQGEGGALPTKDLKETGRGQLSDRLAELAGEVFAGAGAEGLYDAARVEFERYFTGGGAVKQAGEAPLGKAARDLEAARKEHAEQEQRLKEHTGRLDEHDRLQTKIARLDEQLPELAHRRDEAKGAAVRLEALDRELTTVQQDFRVAAAALAQARRVRDGRAKQRQDLASVGAEHGRLQEKLDEEEALLPSLEAAGRERATALAAARKRREAAERALDHDRILLRLAMAQAELADVRERIERVVAHERELAEVERTLPSLAVTRRDLDALRELVRAQEAADVRLEAASARLELIALTALRGRLGDEALDLTAGARRAVLIDQPTELVLGDLAELRIRPGGEDLADRRHGAELAHAAVSDRLRALGVESEEAAAAVEQARAEALTTRDRLRGVLEAQKPEELRRRAAELEGVVEVEAARLPAGTSSGPVEDPDVLDARIQKDDRALRALREEEDAAVLSEQEVETEVARVRASLDGRRREAQGAAVRMRALEVAIEAGEATDGSDETLEAASDSAVAENERLTVALAELQQRRDALDPDGVARQLASTTRSLSSAKNERDEAQQRRIRVEGELGGQNLQIHDEVARTVERVRAAEREHATQEARAAAAKLLYETLKACRDRAQQRHMAPLHDQLRRLLPLLFRGASIELDDSLHDLQLDRGAEEGKHAFDDLSAGAQEQLGVLVRLSLARLMSAGEPQPVLLDDALVATDEVRFARMADVLAAAAEDLQIILLTCHWERLRRLGLAPHNQVDLEAIIRG